MVIEAVFMYIPLWYFDAEAVYAWINEERE